LADLKSNGDDLFHADLVRRNGDGSEADHPSRVFLGVRA
jgi:hypothetical protein